MVKRWLFCLMALPLILLLNGCWNYRGLDQMNIVVGIAVDFDETENMYNVSYEVADLAGADKNKGITGRIITSKGKTMFESSRNAKLRDPDKLFFGSPPVLIINQDYARKRGIMNMLEWFLQDGECRETMYVAISQEETASEILEGGKSSNSIVSSNLHDMIGEDKDVTGTVFKTELYQVYNSLFSPRNSVVLPALRKVQNQDETVPELNGSAVIKDGKLVGYLTPEQSRYLLFVENKLGSAILTLSIPEMKTEDISLEVFTDRAKKSYRIEDDKIIVEIKVRNHVAIGENQMNIDVMDEEVIKQIERAAEQLIETNTQNVISILQHEFNTDALGFGEMIYKKDYKLWNKLAPSWDEIFPTLEVKISADVIIDNSAFNK